MVLFGRIFGKCSVKFLAVNLDNGEQIRGTLKLEFFNTRPECIADELHSYFLCEKGIRLTNIKIVSY